MKNNNFEITISHEDASVEFAIKYGNINDLEIALYKAAYTLKNLHIGACQEITKRDREAAFIRYCFTGKFD